MARRFLSIAAVLAGLVAVPGVAGANPVATGNVEARLVAETASVPPGESFLVALRQKIRPGWHTYWRNPGDSGEPTQIEWQLPEGFSAGAIEWPVPERIPYGPLLNYGYENEVWLLARIDAPAGLPAGEPVSLTARAFWLVCADICIPEEATLSLTLPAGPASTDARWAEGFRRAKEALPVESPWPAAYSADGESLMLRLAGPGLDTSRIESAAYIPSSDGIIGNAAPQRLSLSPEGLTLALTPGYRKPDGAPLTGLVVLEERLEDGVVRRGLSIEATPSAVPIEAAPAGMPLWQAALLALAGGLLLNLMPCVFPVLSMKAMALLKTAQGREAGVSRAAGWSEARIGALAYTAGVLASFAALAGVLLAIRAGGAAVGWGFQLQSPAVVLLLAYLLFAVGLNLSGVFDVGGRLSGIGGGLVRGGPGGGGAAGSFFTGVLAAVVATPCTAPFMAAAAGFALTQSAPVAMALFVALGLGMALPFLLLGVAPRALALLPRPGPWMETLKQALAFPMYASAAWLVWVLGRQAGADAVLLAGIGMVAIAFAAWLYEKSRGAATRGRIAGAATAAAVALLVLGTAAIPAAATGPARSASADTEALAGEPFSAARLAELRAAGTPVFVNMTADWCITCLVNERVALRSDAVADAFASGGVTYLKGDWTRRDAEITRVLERFGRAGVPLYVFYPPAGEPVVLPQILTEGTVLSALSAAIPAADASPSRNANMETRR
ncbi:MAG: protein-disulfide reductase DsbD domain-containing protein [Acetobacterales bacterium]